MNNWRARANKKPQKRIESMTPDTINRLNTELASSPILIAKSLPTELEIEKAAQELGIPFTNDYVEFLQKFGGAVVGAFPIFGLRPVPVMGKSWSVLEMTNWYRQQSIPEANKWVVFSEDHAGNPVGFDESGVVWTYDHDFGGTTRLMNSFEDYLRKRCLKID